MCNLVTISGTSINKSRAGLQRKAERLLTLIWQIHLAWYQPYNTDRGEKAAPSYLLPSYNPFTMSTRIKLTLVCLWTSHALMSATDDMIRSQGTAQFGRGAPPLGARVNNVEDAQKLVDLFVSYGHDKLDTARVYGAGSSEEVRTHYAGATAFEKPLGDARGGCSLHASLAAHRSA